MKKIKVLIISVVVVALVGFTATYLITAYNKGDIGHKAEKIADEFENQLVGSWKGKYQISKLKFNEDNTVSLTILGATVNGKYEDTYDIKNDKHTVEITYTEFGLSVSREFKVSIYNDVMVLVDSKIESVEMRYTRTDGTEEETTTEVSNKLVEDITSNTTVTNETVPVYNKDTEAVYKKLLGKWNSNTNSSSGYEFFDNSIAKVTLLGISYNGTYSLSLEEETGKCVLTVVYATVGNIEIRNRSYVEFKEEGSLEMTLVETGVVLDYTRANS